MFHKFSATPANARSQTQNSRSARISNDPNNHSIGNAASRPGLEHKAVPPVKRHKVARACDRCRRHRLKCDEQKPCAQCVGIKAKCMMSYPLPRTSRASNSGTDHTRYVSSALPSRSPPPSPSHVTCHDNNASPISLSASPSHSTCIGQESSHMTRTAPENVPMESFDLAHMQGFFASGQSSCSYTPALGGCLFPQLPYPSLPSGEGLPVPNALPKGQRSCLLRLFWDTCHPLLQILSETEFAELVSMPPSTMGDEFSVKNALLDSMIALGIQHSNATGRAWRVLGLQQLRSLDTARPGFEYFHRCRECMRTTTEVTLEVLRCHALMVLYLMKGNAIHDAYNLIGITIRKAYVIKLHQQPPSHLPEAAKIAHMQLWWMLFSLDLQCSLQLDLPPVSQKSLVTCPFPAEDALTRFLSFSSHSEKGMYAYIYSARLAKLAVIVSDISECTSTAGLADDDSISSATREHHALNLSSALQKLEAWRDQIPPELLLLCQCANGSANTEVLDFDRALALPDWLLRQAVLLELHYHNAFMMIQRPFVRLLYAHSGDTRGMINPPDSREPHLELHIASALEHATLIVDLVFTVCSMSDVLYGWSEILQPLWNATLTIMAYLSANSLSSVVPRALETLTRAQAVFEFFSPLARLPSPPKPLSIRSPTAYMIQ